MRSKARNNLALLAALVVLCLAAAASDYRTDFSHAAPGALPKDLQAVGGSFRVVDVEKNKLLELPGEPLEIGGALFGPAQTGPIEVRARAWGARSGRRFPEFGVGAGDVGGYRLMYLPGQRRVELRKGDEVLKVLDATESINPDGWIWMRLRLAKGPDGRWFADGTVWPDGAQASGPVTPQRVNVEMKDPPPPGRPSVWGIPFSGKPIRFDDLSVSATPAP